MPGTLTITTPRTTCASTSRSLKPRSRPSSGHSSIPWRTSMPSWQPPTPDEVSKAIALLARPEQRRYFFDKLNNPRWITPLADRGFFMHPPTPLRDDAQGTIQFPPWPLSQYLARMARLPDAQEEVLRIALNIPATENMMVHRDLAE